MTDTTQTIAQIVAEAMQPAGTRKPIYELRLTQPMAIQSAARRAVAAAAILDRIDTDNPNEAGTIDQLRSELGELETAAELLSPDEFGSYEGDPYSAAAAAQSAIRSSAAELIEGVAPPAPQLVNAEQAITAAGYDWMTWYIEHYRRPRSEWVLQVINGVYHIDPADIPTDDDDPDPSPPAPTEWPTRRRAADRPMTAQRKAAAQLAAADRPASSQPKQKPTRSSRPECPECGYPMTISHSLIFGRRLRYIENAPECYRCRSTAYIERVIAGRSEYSADAVMTAVGVEVAPELLADVIAALDDDTADRFWRRADRRWSSPKLPAAQRVNRIAAIIEQREYEQQQEQTDNDDDDDDDPPPSPDAGSDRPAPQSDTAHSVAAQLQAIVAGTAPKTRGSLADLSSADAVERRDELLIEQLDRLSAPVAITPAARVAYQQITAHDHEFDSDDDGSDAVALAREYLADAVAAAYDYDLRYRQYRRERINALDAADEANTDSGAAAALARAHDVILLVAAALTTDDAPPPTPEPPAPAPTASDDDAPSCPDCGSRSIGRGSITGDPFCRDCQSSAIAGADGVWAGVSRQLARELRSAARPSIAATAPIETVAVAIADDDSPAPVWREQQPQQQQSRPPQQPQPADIASIAASIARSAAAALQKHPVISERPMLAAVAVDARYIVSHARRLSSQSDAYARRWYLDAIEAAASRITRRLSDASDDPAPSWQEQPRQQQQSRDADASPDRPARLRSAAAAIAPTSPQSAALLLELAATDPSERVAATHNIAAPAYDSPDDDAQRAGWIASCGRVVADDEATDDPAAATCAGCRLSLEPPPRVAHVAARIELDAAYADFRAARDPMSERRDRNEDVPLSEYAAAVTPARDRLKAAIRSERAARAAAEAAAGADTDAP